LTAALYTSRQGMKSLVLTKDIGGQVALTDFVENYPGVEKISGPKLAEKFLEQAKRFGAKIVFSEVSKVKRKGERFLVETKEKGNYEGKTLILAFGRTPRRLKVPGEEKFRNKGVSYCATCDAPLFAGKKVAVVGGGSSALGAALLLADIASMVYLVHRRKDFRAEDFLVKRVLKNSKIKFLPEQIIKKIQGSQFLESLVLESVHTGRISEIEVAGLFVEIGSEIKGDFLGDLVKRGAKREIFVDKFAATSAPGVFAAGDATEVPYQQISVSVGEGAKAALSAHAYLKRQKLGESMEADHGSLG